MSNRARGRTLAGRTTGTGGVSCVIFDVGRGGDLGRATGVRAGCHQGTMATAVVAANGNHTVVRFHSMDLIRCISNAVSSSMVKPLLQHAKSSSKGGTTSSISLNLAK